MLRTSTLPALLLALALASCSKSGEMPATRLARLSPEAPSQTSDSADAHSSAAQMRESAARFLEALSAEERQAATYELADANERTRWSNLPASMVERGGIRAGDLTSEQRRRLHDLIRASTSSQGYLKISGIMWLDDILQAEVLPRVGPGDDRFRRLVESWTTENYWVSVFGDPEAHASWGWLLSGHHLAATFTVSGGQVAFTPMFLGAEPYEIESGPYAGWRILSHEVERGFELQQALTSEQRGLAVISQDVPRDVLEGPGRKASLSSYQGIAASALSQAQRSLLWHLIEEYVRNADHDAAESQLAEIERDGLDSLRFAWIGPTGDLAERYYYRVHGPSILIEYVRERAVGGRQGAANHVHTMVRDPGNDYGEDWLETHYRERHR